MSEEALQACMDRHLEHAAMVFMLDDELGTVWACFHSDGNKPGGSACGGLAGLYWLAGGGVGVACLSDEDVACSQTLQPCALHRAAKSMCPSSN